MEKEEVIEMKIYKHMLNELSFKSKVLTGLTAKYMEYIKKPKPFVMQSHYIGKSQHLDWRMKVDNYLIGWSIVGGNIENPITPDRLLKESPKQFRGETKARQPVMWLKVEGEVKPGEVGAAIEKPGRFVIHTTGKWISGAQKPYYHEYFLKDNKYFKDWTRIEVRAAKVPRLKERKVPTEVKERVWLVRIPKEQKPYALGSGLKKKWKPPKGYIPFPKEWAKEKYPEEYKKFKELISGKKEEELSQIKFALSLATWMGARAKTGRRMPKFNWYLLLDDRGKGTVRTFFLDGYPLKEDIMGAYEEERTARKWMEYQGKTKPGTRFNPNKKLVGNYSIIDSGNTSYEVFKEDGLERIVLKMKGKVLKGTWELIQEEKESDVYSFLKTSKASEIAELKEVKFVIDRHEVPANSNKVHYDIRWESNGKLEEFNLYLSPLDVGIEEPIKAVRKTCPDKSWLEVKKPNTIKYVGPLKTSVSTVDYGTLEVIEDNPKFISFNLKGQKIKGIWIARKVNNTWEFMKSKLPKVLSLLDRLYTLLGNMGNPRTGEYFTPFKIEEKKGWNYFIVYLYDLREFTRIEPQSKVKEYLDIDIPSGVTVGIGLFRVPGKIHQARVAFVKFEKEEWDYDKAESWIKKNKLHTWIHSMIRKRKEELQEEMKIWFKITNLDVPGREVQGYILTEKGTENKAIFKVLSDELMEEILELYSNGYSLFWLRAYGGQIIQILDYVKSRTVEKRRWICQKTYGNG